MRLTTREWAMLVAVLIFYAATRLWGIADFPIYFFCDEAHQANLAQNLVINDFRDEDGNLFPTYFRNVRVFNLGLSVWLHAFPIALFGKTIVVVRTTSVAVGLIGAAALMLALKWFFAARLWWAGGLVMAAFPAWFLHSRTAFETAMMVGFYATFILAYLLYRVVSPRWAPAAVLCGAATFYSYSNGQGVMFVTCLILLVVDWRYHWNVVRNHRGAAAAGVLTVLLVATPYVHFRFVLHPEMMGNHFVDLHSYWIEDIPTSAKMKVFASTYLRGLSPGYWFTEDTSELVRHRMLGYPYLSAWLAPMILIGAVLSIARFRRSPPHRLVVIAIAAAPFSASLVDLRITRVLAMVVPAALAATIGLEWIRIRLIRKISDRVVAAAVALGLTVGSTAMTHDALANGPRWFSDYGMHGMQWGAKEVFAAVRRHLATADPDSRVWISHIWANNANSYGDFFLNEYEQRRISWGAVDDLLISRNSLVNPDTLFILTAEEFEVVQESPKVEIEGDIVVIPDPAGQPGFFLVRLTYTAEADTFFAAEREERRQLTDTTLTIDGTGVRIRHPKLDMGAIGDAFDGNLRSLARTLDGNPTNLFLSFSQPRSVAGVRLHLWADHYKVDIRATRSDGEVVETRTVHDTGISPEAFEVRFEQEISDVVQLDLRIAKRGDQHVHMREIEILDRRVDAGRRTPDAGSRD